MVVFIKVFAIELDAVAGFMIVMPPIPPFAFTLTVLAAFIAPDVKEPVMSEDVAIHSTEQLCATTIVTLKSLKYAGETPHGENPSRP